MSRQFLFSVHSFYLLLLLPLFLLLILSPPPPPPAPPLPPYYPPLLLLSPSPPLLLILLFLLLLLPPSDICCRFWFERLNNEYHSIKRNIPSKTTLGDYLKREKKIGFRITSLLLINSCETPCRALILTQYLFTDNMILDPIDQPAGQV